MPAKKHAKSTSLPLETPLHSAARLPPNAAAPLLRQLLAAAADPHKTDQFGQTPLHVAVASSGQGLCAARIRAEPAAAHGEADGAAAAVRSLLDGGADAERRDDSGSTPLELGQQHGQLPPDVTLAFQQHQGAAAERAPAATL